MLVTLEQMSPNCFHSGPDNRKNNKRWSHTHCVQYLQITAKSVRKRHRTIFKIPCDSHG